MIAVTCSMPFSWRRCLDSFEEARADCSFLSFWGRMVEGALGAHLVHTASPNTAVKYLRDGRYEVDFVLQRGPSTVAIRNRRE